MRARWETKPLAEVCEIQPPKSEARTRLRADELVSFAPMETLGIGEKHTRINLEKPLSSVVGSYTYFADGDVLLAKITPCFENGKLGIASGLRNGVGFGSSEFIVLRPSARLDNEFLYYFLDRPEFRIEGAARMGGAVGQQRVPKEFIQSYRIPVPPVSEQRRIVGILDKAFEGIATAKANAEKNLQNATELFEHELQALFAVRGPQWIEKPLGELAVFRNGINFTQSSRGEFAQIVGVKDFQQNFWAPLDELESVTIDGALSDADLLQENDLLFVRSNGNKDLIGRSLLVGKVDSRITHSGFTIRARLNDDAVGAKYLCHFLKSAGMRREMIDSGIGTNIKSLNQAILSALVVPFPPRTEQLRIVQKLERFAEEARYLKSIYRQKFEVLDALKQSLLHHAFSGNL